MIHDQADELRQLARKDAVRRAPHKSSLARLVVVAGGKGGVGATTVAVNLAVALALDGRRAMLVDADLCGANAAALCGLDVKYSLLDVLAGDRDLHEILLPGPAGIQVLPGAWPGGVVPECPPRAQERLIDNLRTLGTHVDCVIVDVGSGLNRFASRFWQAADSVLLVTRPESVSVMDAYAKIKVLLPRDCPVPVGTVVNSADDRDQAADIHDRLARACRRFLGREISAAGVIPYDRGVDSAGTAKPPVALHRAHSTAARSIAGLAESVARLLPPAVLTNQNMGNRRRVAAA